MTQATRLLCTSGCRALRELKFAKPTLTKPEQPRASRRETEVGLARVTLLRRRRSLGGGGRVASGTVPSWKELPWEQAKMHRQLEEFGANRPELTIGNGHALDVEDIKPTS